MFNIIASTTACSTLSNPLNGMVKTTGSSSATLATYSCNSGLQLQGYPQRICTVDGRWTGTAPTCMPIGKTLCLKHVNYVALYEILKWSFDSWL